MSKVWLIQMRIFCCFIIFMLPIDMLVMGKRRAWEDFKLLWNDRYKRNVSRIRDDRSNTRSS